MGVNLNLPTKGKRHKFHICLYEPYRLIVGKRKVKVKQCGVCHRKQGDRK